MRNSLGQLLKAFRMEQNMSLREFSLFLGISHGYLDRLEKGVDQRTGKEISPTIDLLVQFADRMQMPKRIFFEKCGYIESSLLTLNEAHSTEAVDILEAIETLIISLCTAQSVACGPHTLSPEAVGTVSTALTTLAKQLRETYPPDDYSEEGPTP